ncbi:MAG: DoxX family protein, partial [Rhodococcus sp. (in: high G+C Gram-positive bacteria)]
CRWCITDQTTEVVAMSALFNRTLGLSGSRANLLVRMLVGLVFLPEGVKKFLFPEQWGAGRFLRIGIPAPQTMAHLVGAVEIACGLLILAGFLTRLSALILAIDISVAIALTKIPLLWRVTAVSTHVGFWSMQGGVTHRLRDADGHAVPGAGWRGLAVGRCTARQA